jgi:hypothetical protein
MKKIYFFASMLMFSSLTVAQTFPAQKSMMSNDGVEASRPLTNSNRAAGDVIGSTFTFDTPSNWTIGSEWVIGPDGPTGFYSGGMGIINSTSGVDFALIDADGFSGSAVMTMANSVNLTGYLNVAFQFESYFRHFQGQCFFEISNDGTTWTTFPVHELVLLNENTENPEIVSVNISSVAANQATVWARFRYESADDYAWMIDDVAFIEGYSNNLILAETYMSAGNEGLDYYMIPTSQIMDFTYGAKVQNNGSVDQTNTNLTVKVNDGSSDIYNQSSATATVTAFLTDSFEVSATAWTPPGPGTYTTDYLINSADFTDEAPNDDDDTLLEITVGGNVYARDNGLISGSVGYLGNNPVNTICGNYFEFAGNFSLGKVQVGLSDQSGVGENIYLDVRKWDGTDFVFVTGSSDYTITSSDLGALAEIELQDVVDVVAGDVLMIGAGHYASSTIRFLEGQTAPGAVIYNDGAASQQNSVFMIRAVEVFAGVDEIASASGVSMFPNPANNETSLNYNLNASANVAMEIVDVNGKVVFTENFGQQETGSYKFDVSTANLSNGLYVYSIFVDGVATTKKFVVSH